MQFRILFNRQPLVETYCVIGPFIRLPAGRYALDGYVITIDRYSCRYIFFRTLKRVAAATPQKFIFPVEFQVEVVVVWNIEVNIDLAARDQVKVEEIDEVMLLVEIPGLLGAR